jgi:hypothetical protein
MAKPLNVDPTWLPAPHAHVAAAKWDAACTDGKFSVSWGPRQD